MNSRWLNRWCYGVAVAGIGAVLLPLSGCGKAAEIAAEKAAEKAIESEMGGDADVEIDKDGQITVKAGDGEKTLNINSKDGNMTMQAGDGKSAMTMEAGESVALPDSLPADVPLPEGATWNLVQQSTGEAQGLMLQGSVATAMADLAATLKSQATAQGWTLVQETNVPNQMALMSFSKGEQSLNYTLGMDGDKTTVMVATG